MAKTPKIQIAIVGGGLAGAAIALALHQQAHVQVNVYESASEFSEKGLGIVMAINAQRALGKLVPDVEALFERAGAVTVNSTRIMLVSYVPFSNNSLFIGFWRERKADGYTGCGTRRRHESDRYRGRKTW
jgi:2-polyprenyl-6-methoxyphenol hydroxylase-like FAD-dependent oxidoreductase